MHCNHWKHGFVIILMCNYVHNLLYALGTKYNLLLIYLLLIHAIVCVTGFWKNDQIVTQDLHILLLA